MRVLVLGARGLLGEAVVRAAARAGVPAVGAARAQVDITDAAAVRAAVAQAGPDAVVNAAAYTGVDAAEAEPERAFAVNEAGAANVAAACAAAGAALVHVSTDYVFDGRLRRAYRESDEPAPLGVYGLSKRAGERAVAAALERHAIVRTSWLFGDPDRGFVPGIALRALRGEPLRVVADQFSCPTAIDDLAPALLIIARALVDDAAGACGTFHVCGTPPASRFALVRCALDGLGGRAATVPLEPIAAARAGDAAPRPPRSVLDAGLAARVFGLGPFDWRPRLRAFAGRIAAGHGPPGAGPPAPPAL